MSSIPSASDKAIVPAPQADDVLKAGAPEPLAVFNSRTIHPDNIVIEERARNAALLPKAQVKALRKELAALEKHLHTQTYARKRDQLEVIRGRFVEALALHRASEGDQRADHEKQLNKLLLDAESIKADLRALAPDYRRYTAIKRKLDDHQAAVEREKIHLELRRKMAKEAAIQAEIIIRTWSRLGYHYEYTKKNRTHRKYVKFVDCVVTPDNIQLKIFASRLGLFGGAINMLPQGVWVSDLTDERTLSELSIACEREVTAKVHPVSGAWIWINRLGIVGGLLERVTYQQVMSYYPESERDYLPLCVGVGTGREIHWIHLAKHPHMLIGGSTGNGKSNFINSMICTLISRYSPDDLRLVLVDLKEGMEFTDYKGLPHLLTPVVEEVDQLTAVLIQLETLRKERGKRFQGLMARDRYEYNSRASEPEPAIIVIIDEYASINSDRQQAKVIQNLIMQLVNKGRAVGIHVIICTQNPSVDVLPGASKANLGMRMAFQMPTKSGSQTILGIGDAADLAPIPGRAIAMVGSKKWPVQTPLVQAADIQRALNIANAYEAPAPLVLPESTVAAPGFGENDLIRVALDYFDGRIVSRPIYEFIKNEQDVTQKSLAEMVQRIIAKGAITFDEKHYVVKKEKGRGSRLVEVENLPENVLEN